ncbi:hypothetical protein GUITHDRAFT_103148 [Guillardia theta CCMP2712]|uniref:Uncharacterized protein n=1 Tax=Guillardia theta (strain CCMP2712) TaxID=905079 RepID=L1JSR7_GUITC|nr:hypothetical protein GUITHDRAFT_103148 [Guillardia theta CCMP2712]EKX51230.1 hypothetical protein GUITHDRAFT_103148 [Guillardia theta CCMP2712]|eukprot:XP_005838210.1 hypothetical protein GUITHDRAFT_103148 [Guillardia theta CCMP2712]
MEQPVEAEDPIGAPPRVGTDVEGPQGDGEQRKLEIILQCVMQFHDGAIFDEVKKEKTMKQVQEMLNGHPMFAGQLMLNTLKDKWRKIEKRAEEIANGGEEKWVRLWQNGDGELSEMHKLILDLAGRMRAMKDRKEWEKRDAEGMQKNARKRLLEAMETTAKRRGYNNAAQAEEWLEEEGGSYGRGTSGGLQKRAKQDPALHPNRKGPNHNSRSLSSDRVALVLGQQDRLCNVLESSLANDIAVLEQFWKAQILMARAAKMNAQAARTKEVAAAINAFVAAQEKGVYLPRGLMKLLEDD